MRYPTRRSFLENLAMLIPATTLGTSHKPSSEPSYRFETPDCEVEMSVKSYGKITTDDLGFIDRVTNQRMCAPEPSSKNQTCVSGFRGALAVAIYHFSSKKPSRMPGQLRERVVTIDHDRRIDPKPPVDEFVAVERDVASDIQAFGYTPDRLSGQMPAPLYVSPWCLMRQDLYLDQQTVPFLILHWKHSLESIQLVDVIPGDRTRPIGS
ncbi:MAG: hypothetical protein WB985_11515 [Candidatus Acidiferrales bacterium]